VKILLLSWKNLLAKPMNTMLSVLLMALSIGLIVFLQLFNDQFKKGLESNLAGIDLVIGAKGSPLQLILNSMYHIDAPTGNIPLSGASPFLNPMHPLIAQAVPLSLGDSYGAFRIVGAPQSILSLYGAGKLEGELYRQEFEVVVGSIVARKLHLHTGDTFFSTHGLEENPDLAHDHGSPFEVKGILQPTGTVLDQLILCTPATVWMVHEHTVESNEEQTGDEGHAGHDHGEEAGGHQHVTLPIRDIDTLEARSLSDSIISSLRRQPDREITSILVRYKSRTNLQALNLLRNINTNTDLMAASPALEINRLYAMLGSGTDALHYLAILIAVVAAISVFISLYGSLKERRYEMALMRVAGAGPGSLMTMILGEGLWIALVGAALGFVFGHGGMELAGGLLEKGYRYPFSGSHWVPAEGWVLAGALLVGLVASLVPAVQGARTDLHRTLAEG